MFIKLKVFYYAIKNKNNMILDPLFYFRAFWQAVFGIEAFFFFGTIENIMQLANKHIMKPYMGVNLDEVALVKAYR